MTFDPQIIGYLVFTHTGSGKIDYRPLPDYQIGSSILKTPANQRVWEDLPKDVSDTTIHRVYKLDGVVFTGMGIYHGHGSYAPMHLSSFGDKSDEYNKLVRITDCPAVLWYTAGDSGVMCEFTIINGREKITRQTEKRYNEDCPVMATLPKLITEAAEQLKSSQRNFPRPAASQAPALQVS